MIIEGINNQNFKLFDEILSLILSGTANQCLRVWKK